MQTIDVFPSTHLDDQTKLAIEISESTNRHGLNKLVAKGRSMLVPQHMFLKHRDEEIINIHHFKQHQTRKNERTKTLKIKSSQERIAINVSGVRFETLKSTLDRFPNTLLGNEKRRRYYYDQVHNEYFFDRHRLCFEAILYYYQSAGRLIRPNDIPLDAFLDEIMFFDLDKEVLAQIQNDENLIEVKKVHLPHNRCRRYIWATLEYPEFSLLAKIIHFLSFIIIVIATIGLAFESLPQYANSVEHACKDIIEYTDNSTKVNSSTSNNYICLAYFSSPFIIIQTTCVGLFTIELIFRLICMPSLCDFIKDVMNWIDLFSIVPYYIMIFIRLNGGKMDINSTAHTALELTRVFSFARVFKFYRIFKNVKAIRVLILTLKSSIFDFFILITSLTLMATLFGAGVYFCETAYGSESIDSLPKAIYWGIITITTVGYGDIMLTTWGGRLIACFCALTGTCIVAMLVSVLVERYQRLFTRKIYVKPDKIDFDRDSNIDNEDLELGHVNQCFTDDIDNGNVRSKQSHIVDDTFVRTIMMTR